MGYFCHGCRKGLSDQYFNCSVSMCCTMLCKNCRYCDEHDTLKKLRLELKYIKSVCEIYREGGDLSSNYCFCMARQTGFENEIAFMETNISSGFKTMQKVHGKKIPDDVSRLITSFLY